MRYRPHRGHLADSLDETVEFASRSELIAHIRKEMLSWPSFEFSEDQIVIEPYGGDEERTGWKDLHIVSGHKIVFGFCEGPASTQVEAGSEYTF